MVRFSATLWKVTSDHEGEVKLVLLVPKIDKLKALAIPDGTSLQISVEELGEETL